MSESLPGQNNLPGQGARPSRKALRERAAQIDAEKIALAELDTAPQAVAPKPISTGPIVVTPVTSPAVVSEVIVEQPAPVSRVNRRSTTQMVPRRPKPPSPPVITNPALPLSGATAAVSATKPVVIEDAALTRPAFAPLETPPVAGVARPAPEGLPPGVPPWEAITSGASPASLNSEATLVPTPTTDLRSPADARIPPPSAGYTWLQYLILLAVAFVLGLLLWQLISGEIHLPIDGGVSAAAIWNHLLEMQI